MLNFVVAQNGKGDFTTIQAAVDAVPVHPRDEVKIYVKAGVYEETIIIPDNKPGIRIVGEDNERTLIVYGNYAKMKDSNEHEIGTFQTAVVYAHADDFIMENITVENNAGFGEEIGQAIALYISGDRCVFNHVRLLGNENTLYLSKGRHYFLDSYIEGHVDFIFGAGTGVFDTCIIHSIRSGNITAASTRMEQEFGFIFINCRLTGNHEADTVFLGRPWRPFAHTVFIKTWMGEHIKRSGWDNWHDKNNEKLPDIPNTKVLDLGHV
ncbi:pectinesterase family protein [Bacillus sp. N9]